AGFRVLAHLPVGQVLSLAADGDGLVAGTGPEGLIYRIGARGDTSRIARTGERYVWGLAPAPGGGWYAATGTKGRLLRVRGTEVRTVLDTEESNLVSLIADGRGAVYAGGDSKGRIYRVTGDRERRTVFDATEDVRVRARRDQGRRGRRNRQQGGALPGGTDHRRHPVAPGSAGADHGTGHRRRRAGLRGHLESRRAVARGARTRRRGRDALAA